MTEPGHCLACGEWLLTREERAQMICDDCACDTRVDDHDVHEPNFASGGPDV